MSIDYTLVLWGPAGRTGLSGILSELHTIATACNSANCPLYYKEIAG